MCFILAFATTATRTTAINVDMRCYRLYMFMYHLKVNNVKETREEKKY